MPPRALLATAVALALGGAGCARVRPNGTDTGPVVRSFRIEGGHRLSADDVKRRLATGETGRWPWSERRHFDPVLWEEDLRRIVRVYEANGLYGAKVREAEVDRRPDGVHLRVRVDEPEPTHVASLEVRGLDALPERVARRARERIRLRAGEPFREGDWEGSKSAVERSLRDDGYAEAAAGGAARVDVERREADLRLEIEPGPRYRFGDLYLVTSADPSFPIDPILAHARSLLREDAWFSQSRLASAQRRLFDLGIFESVEVTAAAATPGSDRLPLVVDVREAPLVSARAGAGAGFAPGRTEVRGLAEWTHRNFGGGLRALHAEARAGYAFLPSFWGAFAAGGHEPRRDGPFARVAVDVAQPRLAGVPSLEVFGSTELERDLRDAYAFASARLEGGVGWHAAAEIDGHASYAVDLYALSATPLLGRGAPEAAFGCAGPCRLAYLEQEVTFGRRRGYREPPKGRELTVRLREGGPALGGTFSFVEASADARAYQPLSSRVVLAGRLAAGSVWPLGGDPVPIVLRLFSGGPGMRGFGARRLSPLLLVPSGRDVLAVPTGGRGLLEAALEARVGVGGSFAVAAFVDAGAVTPRSFDPVLAARALQLAPGVGLRWLSTLGPLRADVATTLPWGPSLPVEALPGAAIAPGAAARAASRQDCCAVHISFGEAF